MKTIPEDIKTKYATPFQVRLHSDGVGDFTFDRAGGIMALGGTMEPGGTVLISTADLVRLDYKAEANDRTRQILLHLLGLTDAGYPLGKPKTSDALAGEVARMFTREAENKIAVEKEAARARVDAGRQRDRAEHAEASLRAERKWHEDALARLRKANQELAEWRRGARQVTFPSGHRVETDSKSGGTATVQAESWCVTPDQMRAIDERLKEAIDEAASKVTSTRLDGKPDVECKCCGRIHGDVIEGAREPKPPVVGTRGPGIYATNDMEKGDVMLIDMDRGTATSIGKVAPAPKADPTAKALMERIETLERERTILNRNLATAQGWVGQLGAENGRLKGELMDAKIKLSDINNALGRIEGLASKLKNAAAR